MEVTWNPPCPQSNNIWHSYGLYGKEPKYLASIFLKCNATMLEDVHILENCTFSLAYFIAHFYLIKFLLVIIQNTTMSQCKSPFYTMSRDQNFQMVMWIFLCLRSLCSVPWPQEFPTHLVSQFLITLYKTALSHITVRCLKWNVGVKCV